MRGGCRHDYALRLKALREPISQTIVGATNIPQIDTGRNQYYVRRVDAGRHISNDEQSSM